MSVGKTKCISPIWCRIQCCSYCSSCLPRKPAALAASFCSTSPILLRESFPSRQTEPIASPSHIIGLIVSQGYYSGIPSVIFTYFFSSLDAVINFLSLIALSSCLLISLPRKSFFEPPEMAITWSLSVIQTM